jgi:transcription factor HY5
MDEPLAPPGGDVGMIGMLPSGTSVLSSEFNEFGTGSYMHTTGSSNTRSPPISSSVPGADATMISGLVGVDHDFQAMAIQSPLAAPSNMSMPSSQSHVASVYINPAGQTAMSSAPSHIQSEVTPMSQAGRSAGTTAASIAPTSTTAAGATTTTTTAATATSASIHRGNADAAGSTGMNIKHEHMHDDLDENSNDEDDASVGYSKAGRSKSTKARALSASSPYIQPAAPPISALHSAPGKPVDKKQRRLARKAELARQSRRRKKMYVHDLEAKVKELGTKIEELQRKNAKAKADQRLHHLPREEKERRDRQAIIRDDLARRIKQSSFTQKEKSEVSSLVRQFVLNSRERQSRFDLLMDQVTDSIVPGLQVKFALWGLDQDEDFYRTSGLWTTLMRDEVQLTDAQLRSITSERVLIRQERERLAECERLVGRLQTLVTQHFNGLNQRMDRLMQILSPLQLAKYYMWVESNEWCMQMLDSMYLSLPERPPDV